MYRDANNRILCIGCVVVLNGYLYTVDSFNSDRENCVQLKNGGVRTQAHPWDVTIVDHTRDLTGCC